ncbi:hypothetical protein WR25_04241 [Diploscapter pachys]|uniref:Uncharacterized protein n=1 Tax=Diploscapter pachys TaxID=2018661 RepID=A0A2A2K137_9BILA|nr:hypothetical protein WR25_04241 [Diploscapter pachys]
MTIVKLKLISSDLTEKEREKIEKFLVRNRPPTVLRKLFSHHDKQKIHEFMKKRDIEGVLRLVQERLDELPEKDREIAIKYMNIKARE